MSLTVFSPRILHSSTSKKQPGAPQTDFDGHASPSDQKHDGLCKKLIDQSTRQLLRPDPAASIGNWTIRGDSLHVTGAAASASQPIGMYSGNSEA